MTFAAPWALTLFIPLAFAAWRLLRHGRDRGVKFSALSRLPRTGGGWRALAAKSAPFLLIAALALLIVAAARPRSPLARSTRSVDAIAIAMVVDVSGSMDALDLAPKGVQAYTRDMTRLAVVKKLFAKFVEKRPDDLIGLVTFGGYAATRSPLTADHEALLSVLKSVQIPSIAYDAYGRPIAGDEQKTAIGDGISVALLRLKNADLKSKVVILLSDGENNVGSVAPKEAADAAREMGIKIYTIGVGTNADAVPIFGRDFFGRETILTMNMVFDEAQLKEIAATTGGVYFPVDDDQSLERALAEIDSLETTRIDADAYDRWREHFALPLFAGAILAFIAISLSMSAVRRAM